MCERVAHSIDHLFSSYVLRLFVILVISRFGLKGGIWVLIAPVPVIAYLLLLSYIQNYKLTNYFDCS